MIALFQTKRSKQIDECLAELMQRTSKWIPAPSIVFVGNMLKDDLEMHDINIDLYDACNKAMHYRRKQQRIINKAQKGNKH